MRIENDTLFVTANGKEFDFPLPSHANYPVGHHLVIPFDGKFIHVITTEQGWKLGEMVPILVC